MYKARKIIIALCTIIYIEICFCIWKHVNYFFIKTIICKFVLEKLFYIMKYLVSKKTLVICFISCFIAIVSCNKFKNTTTSTIVLDTEEPDYGNKQFFPEENAKINLGRILFYDKNLSLNNSVSCATCHKQAFGFADNVALSNGFDNVKTLRNSIGIHSVTAPFFGSGSVLFWDGRETSLTSLITKPISNHIEMGMDNPDKLISKLNALPYYKDLVRKAYSNTDQLTIDILSESVTHFLMQLNSREAKIDKAINNSNTNFFTALEKHGEQLFNNTYNCNRCHIPVAPYYGGTSAFVNIGLDINNADKGRMNITGETEKEGAFKIPDLHNVALTAPYMHDGRFNTLEEVLEHYSRNIKQNKNLDPRLKNADGSPVSLQISAEDKKAIIAYLNTFTDYKVVTNPIYASPFKSK